MEKWFLTRKGGDFGKIGEEFGISPIVARLIRNKDIVGFDAIDEYLNGTIASLHDGMLMKDMDTAVEILVEKIREGKRIRIIGDYDIDGINATYILLEGLERNGALVDVDIPDRMKDGYGLNRNLIDRAFAEEVDTIITCDNGIAAYEEIAYGKTLGMTILVTDHHEVPYEERDGERVFRLPPADAVVDPKRADCTYPFPHLCGAAVAYKLVEALCNVFDGDASDVDYLMENVAIATVGDVMDLVGENRIFVRQGLEMLKRTANLGLRALIECTGMDRDRISTYHIGFVLGPCLNASGRLDTAKRALELLRAKTKKEADMLAGDLKALNDNRKDMTALAVKEAEELVETTDLKEDKVLVIYLPDCHESLAGIVAGRIRETYTKPVFVLTKGEEGVKGSGRSIEAYHMYEGMNRCKELLTKFGGHKLAAGLSLTEENLPLFRKKINAECTLTEEDFAEKVSIDMQLPLSYVSERLVEEIAMLEPFGKGNAKPLFVQKDIELLGGRILGRNGNVLKMKVTDGQGTEMDALYFGNIERLKETLSEKYDKLAVKQFLMGERTGMKLDMTYYPSVNEYMGERTVQITIQNYK